MGDGFDGGRERLFIKLIMPRQGMERPVLGGGGPVHPFRDVTREFRGLLSNQVRAIRAAIAPIVPRTGGAPVRVKILPKASAKSHRPEHLFSNQTCPIVGAGGLGELFVKATTDGLDSLDKMIQTNTADRMVKEISTIEAIEPITPDFRRQGISSEELLRHSPRRGTTFATHVQLFDFGLGRGQDALVTDFLEACKSRNIHVSGNGYSETSYQFEADCRNVADVEVVSRVIGVRSIRGMPRIHGVNPQASQISPLPDTLPVPLQDIGDLPAVVVVDSGIADVPALVPWLVGREQEVAPEYRNTEHGTFVAGLIALGKQLNPTLQGIDANPCCVFDLQVIPNWDPAHGDTDALYEPELLQILENALQRLSNRYKVWNLSLGSDQVCSLTEFSSLAVQLDDLQQRYNVSFVISAGNYETVPLLGYPRTQQELERGRITSPADSVLGISVGAVSHHGHVQNGPDVGHPSSFSRNGPGPNYIIKPDLSHNGGTCCIDATDIHGVRSVMGNGTAEAIGTSFAAPLVSRILANIYHQVTPTPTPVLARAILTHHARDPRSGNRVSDNDVNYVGFGLPAPLPYCLECTPYTSTLVFEDALRPSYFLEWDDFPYPPSLKRDGKYFGDIWMTIAFSPSRNARWGSEYCETHIDAHFGVYRTQIERATQKPKRKFVGLVPPEHKNPGELYESFQVEKLRKWSPVRTYFGSMGENGEKGDSWRLKVQLLARHGVEDETLSSQPFALIVTIADPSKTAPIYDEMARLIRNRYQAQNLMLRQTIRVQQ
jgi:hypothetical protein